MDAEIKQFRKLLTKHGHYITKARLRLFAALQKHPALSVKELIELLPKHDKATIYRNILTLEQLGVVSRLRLGWHSKLELSDMFRHHHHHLTCIKCGTVSALPENALIERELGLIAKSQNFKQTDHQLEIRGLCNNCR